MGGWSGSVGHKSVRLGCTLQLTDSAISRRVLPVVNTSGVLGAVAAAARKREGKGLGCVMYVRMLVVHRR